MRRITLLCLVLLCILAASAVPFACRGEEAVENTAKASSQADATYLLVGVDKASYSADVMMLVRVKEGALSFLQIPRDSLTAKGRRLNSLFAAACVKAKNEKASDREAYAAGGKALQEALSDAFGITVSAHATVTLEALATLVDAIGGVDVTLERALDYHDPAQELSIHLAAGHQHLDGAAVEGLVRCRNAYPDADYGRMRAQRHLIAALFQKLRREFSPLTLISLFRKAYGEVETNLAFKEGLSLIRTLMAKEVSLSFAALLGESISIGGASMEVLAEKNLAKASAYLGGNFAPVCCRALFLSQNEKANALYFSENPPPFLCEEAA